MSKLMTPAQKSNFNSAARKIKRHYKRTWCGCLTPSEILALIAAGVRPNYSESDVDRFKELQAKGDCSPRWFYFELGKVILPS